MNYLAHLFLAGDSADLMVGGLMGDFLKGIDLGSYSDGVREGVRLHQAIDRFTDGHRVFARSRNRLRPPYRRYAGVLVDVFYDHFLAADWPRYAPAAPLEEFSQRAYGVLADYKAVLPPRLGRMLPYMIEEDWLVSYRTVGGIDRTLKRLSRRLTRANPLPEAAGQLSEHYAELQSDFLLFFPDLITFAERSRAAHSAQENSHGTCS